MLINPALEALQFNRIHDLYRKGAYPRSQTPVLTVFSGESDTARQTLFPLGRRLSSWLRPAFRDDAQRQEWLRALGEAKHQRTHSLKLDQAKDLPLPWPATSYCDYIKPADLTAPPIPIGRAWLKPLEDTPHKPFSPVLVAYSDEELIEAHSGIWKEPFRTFLIDYIALIEGKRLCLRAPAMNAAAREPSPVAPQPRSR